jgi:hypothetical protein
MSDRSGHRFFSRISHGCQVAKIKFTGASIAATERYQKTVGGGSITNPRVTG